MDRILPEWCYSAPMRTPSVSINLRLPPELHARLRERAAEDRRSLNGELVWLLERALADTESA